jgi:hypothetical protein
VDTGAATDTSAADDATSAATGTNADRPAPPDGATGVGGMGPPSGGDTNAATTPTDSEATAVPTVTVNPTTTQEE